MGKRMMTWTAFCVMAAVAFGKGEVAYTRLQSLYSNAGMLEIEKVVLSDTATVVHFTARGKINSSFQFATSTYLSDEAGARYPVKGASGLEVGKPCYIPKSGVAEFRLSFAPMPKDTKIFDLVEGTDKDMFRILGIHDAKFKSRIPEAKEEVDPEEVSEALFQKGKAVVRGQIEGYVRDWNASIVFFNLGTFAQDLIQPFEMSRTCAAVQADGSFCATLDLDHPAWAELEIGKDYPEIPVYVRPGDTLRVVIKGLQENGLALEYASSHPKGCYDNLLKHQDVPVVYYGWEQLTDFGTVLDNDAFLEKVDECVAENMRICDYVAWKHKLSPWETHLLKNRQRLLLTEHNLLMASRLFGEKVTVPKGRQPVKEDFEGYDYSAYKVLDVLPADDPSLAIVPHFASFPSSLNLMWPVANAATYAFFDGASGRDESSKVRAELEKDSLQAGALRGLAGVSGMPWVLQAFWADKVGRLPHGFTPAQRAEVVDRLSAGLTSPFFKRKMRELDSLSVRSASWVYEMPEGDARKSMEQLLKDYRGRFVQVVCFSSPGEEAGFFRNPDVENILMDYGHNCPDVQFVAIANRDAYPDMEAFNGRTNGIGMPAVCWVDGERYLGLQELFRFSASGKQLTFDRNGLVFKQSLDMKDETSFRQRMRRILETEKELK